MPRVLRRPMFRMGGSAEGLTSGLSRPQPTTSRIGFKDGLTAGMKLRKEYYESPALQMRYETAEEYIKFVLSQQLGLDAKAPEMKDYIKEVGDVWKGVTSEDKKKLSRTFCKWEIR